MSFGFASPLVATTASAVGAYVSAVVFHLSAGATVEVSVRAVVVCIAGVLYTNLFEHGWHRYGMHSRRPDRRHATHHRIFYGDKFQTSDPEALREIVTSWYIFPLLLVVHYSVFTAVLGAGLAPMFFLGVLLHFVAYEVTHWYTHVANNSFDRFLSRNRFLGPLRAVQIRHHQLHHANPTVNFNFNPPYAGDRVSRVLRR
jgi:hypothetical protein